ncbi:hypothetical protein Q3G72_005990 [Acer saccharum]|nr:hypothetical protein Q3G72_005990 [Acer saccharum]
MEMANLVANKVGNSFDDNANDTAKNVFDLRAFVGDLTFEEDAGSDDISLEGLEQELEECKNYDASLGDVARSNCPASLYKISIGKEWRQAGKRKTKAGSTKAKCDIASALFNFFFNPEFFKSEARRCTVGSYI